MPNILKKLDGQKFGRLTVKKTFRDVTGTWCKCICDCGKIVVVRSSHLKDGTTLSCKCLQKELIKKSRRDLIGQKFGRLTVIKRQYNKKLQMTFWFCRCICGKIKLVSQQHLLNGHTRSCRCLALLGNHTTHGESRNYLYKLWAGLIQRCCNKANPGYSYYGGRGIIVYSAWRNDYTSFATYIRKNIGERPSKYHSLDRIRNNEGYKPGNVHWATNKEQAKNRRGNLYLSYLEITLLALEWSKRTGLPYNILIGRKERHKYSDEQVLTTPARKFKERPAIIPDLSWISAYKEQNHRESARFSSKES